MSRKFRARVTALEDTINTVLETPRETLAGMGKSARTRYLELDSDFRDNFREIIKSL
jgi:hypothetical protein